MSLVLNKSPFCHALAALVLAMMMTAMNYAVAESADNFPDISGTWLNQPDSNSGNVSKYEIVQDMQYLSGQYTDEQNGRVVMESPIAGLIDKQGNVIFDLYIGKVTATNRLALSADGTKLTGTFSTTIGNEGDVKLYKTE